MTFPAPSMTRARVPPVPTSIPRYAILPPRNALSEISVKVGRCIAIDINFFFVQFLRLPVQEKIEVPPHYQVGSQSDLMRPAVTLHQKLVQHAECDLALGARALINCRGHCAGTDLRNKVGK